MLRIAVSNFCIDYANIIYYLKQKVNTFFIKIVALSNVSCYTISEEVRTINERIKQVRKTLNLSMKAFGEKIGISAPSVTRIESGENNPSEQTIRAICSEFNVNRTWLETGEGKPYKENALVPELVRVLRKYPALYAMLERLVPTMQEADWQALDAFLDRLQKNPPEP